MTTISNGESGLSVRNKINNVLQHADGSASELVINDAGADVNFRVESDTSANALFVDGGTGNVGIGTSLPSGLTRLTINGAGTLGNPSGGIVLQQAGTDVFYIFNVAANNNTDIDLWNPRNGFVRIGTNNTERMRIDSSGAVGIGTSSPTNLLDVNADSIRVRTAQTPATASAAGNQGEIAWDADYIYVCVATDTWKRVAIATW